MIDHKNDVIVVGSGAAALTAALAAKEHGMQPLILESTDLAGGSSAMSGGGLWIPNNSLMAETGVHDSYEAARTYMDRIIGDVGPASSAERRDAYLREAPQLIDWLTGLGFHFTYAYGYSDYYPELPGGKPEGRCVEGEFFNLNKLGAWRKKLRVTIPLPLHSLEARNLAIAMRTLPAFFSTTQVFGRVAANRLIGRRLVGTGGTLVAQLLNLVLQRSIPIWLNSPMVELTMQDGAVAGVVIHHEGNRTQIPTHCVVLAAGGFAHNAEMRQKYHPHPITTEWTSANPGDMGDAIRAGIAAGSAIALMDDAWWGPSFIDSKGKVNFMLWERSLPFGFIVDHTGQRFMNESASYVDCVHWQYERNQAAPAIPAFLIIDSRHRRNYLFGMLPPMITPPSAFRSGFMIRADTIPELADKCGIDPQGLQETVRRFNNFAAIGQDTDFKRGDSAYDRVYSDPRVKPNPNLGAVEKPPFYAVKVWPGDLGTKGGLLTDEFARVLRVDGSPIPGLYAAGNTTASVMGHTYPGPGSTLGPAMTFGMIAGTHASSAK